MPITIHDIANRAGVSHMTVSRVINNSDNVSPATKEKVLEAIEELNYVPNAYARSLCKKETNVIGVVVPEIRNQFFSEIMGGISSVADENELNVLLFNTDESVEKEKRALTILQEQRIRGLIIAPATEHSIFNFEQINSFKRMGIPVVLIDRDIPELELDGLFYDDTKAIFDATTLLLDEGHRDICILAGDYNFSQSTNRVLGYKKAFTNKGLDFEESNIYYGEFSKEWAYNQTMNILNSPKRPTAIVSNSNMLSLGCLKALYESKVNIPKDMAFVGYDRIEVLNIIQSNITIVEKEEFEYGRKAMEFLLKKINKEQPKRQKIIMHASLVKRGSEKLINA